MRTLISTKKRKSLKDALIEASIKETVDRANETWKEIEEEFVFGKYKPESSVEEQINKSRRLGGVNKFDIRNVTEETITELKTPIFFNRPTTRTLYQYCSKCDTETNHKILGNMVMCVYCNTEYLI